MGAYSIRAYKMLAICGVAGLIAGTQEEASGEYIFCLEINFGVRYLGMRAGMGRR